MFPGINPKQMEKVMRQMGIKSENVDAEEVIIKTSDKEIIISNPQVTKIDMKGQETFQIVGEVSERAPESFSDEDVTMVMEQTGKSEGEVKETLIRNQGDIAKTILDLKEE
ncbi:nascent polypeptide-associated complex protein [Candidatus Woesearchaeota archaeon]|nr:nascent polypeptide-associated complex protein [Candidatus Woesearchaeota archaeon]